MLVVQETGTAFRLGFEPSLERALFGDQLRIGASVNIGVSRGQSFQQSAGAGALQYFKRDFGLVEKKKQVYVFVVDFLVLGPEPGADFVTSTKAGRLTFQCLQSVLVIATSRLRISFQSRD